MFVSNVNDVAFVDIRQEKTEGERNWSGDLNFAHYARPSRLAFFAHWYAHKLQLSQGEVIKFCNAVSK